MATSHVPIQFSPIDWCQIHLTQPSQPSSSGPDGASWEDHGPKRTSFPPLRIPRSPSTHPAGKARGSPPLVHGRKTDHFLLGDLWLYGQSLSKVPVLGGFVWLESLTTGRSWIFRRNPYLYCIVDLRWKYPCSLSNCESMLLFCIGIHWQPVMMGWKWAVNLATKGPKASVIFASWMLRKFNVKAPPWKSCSYWLKDFPQEVMRIRILSARSWCIYPSNTNTPTPSEYIKILYPLVN